jgi:class 3 adenylate cyclase/CheY-like chemotaxis protein
VRVPILTLLFTDVEGSTRLVERHGAAGTEALVRHHAIVREVAEASGGRVFERIGDAAYSVFPDASSAVAAAAEIHRRLSAEDFASVPGVRVRTALDTGELEERDGRFFGRSLHRCARIQALARGGETLISEETADQVRERLPAGQRLRDLGEHRLRGLEGSVRVWGLVPSPPQPGPEEGREDAGAPPIRVLLVDDYEVVRRGLRGFLELLPEIEIVGEAANGKEAVEAAYRLQPDVILMDLVMPEMDGPTAIAAIKERQPEITILALTSFSEPERIAAALSAGAAGHLLKDAEAEQVAAAIRSAYAGRLASA